MSNCRRNCSRDEDKHTDKYGMLINLLIKINFKRMRVLSQPFKSKRKKQMQYTCEKVQSPQVHQRLQMQSQETQYQYQAQ